MGPEPHVGRSPHRAEHVVIARKFSCKGSFQSGPYRSGRVAHWVKNPKAPAVKREAEVDGGR
jgi:hypothetical protein